MSPPKVVHIGMSAPNITAWVDYRLDGSPATLHVTWRARNGQVRLHREHFDYGATHYEAMRCLALARRAIRKYGDLDPFP